MKGDIVPHRFSYGVMIDPSKVLEFQSTSLPFSPVVKGRAGREITSARGVIPGQYP